MKTIVTHGGTGHADEFSAICLWLASNPTELFKVCRVGTMQEFSNMADCIYIDIGLSDQYPYFDHHQFALDDTGKDFSNGSPETSFSLVAKHFHLDQHFATLEWYRFMNLADNYGGMGACTRIGIDPFAWRSAHSIIVAGLLDEWSKVTVMQFAHPLYNIMTGIGEYIISLTSTYTADDIKEIAIMEQSVQYQGADVRYTIFFTAGYLSPDKLDKYAKSIGVTDYITVSRSDRDPGWKVYRCPTLAPMIKFRTIPSTLFLHKSGFLTVLKSDAGLAEILSTIEPTTNQKPSKVYIPEVEVPEKITKIIAQKEEW